MTYESETKAHYQDARTAREYREEYEGRFHLRNLRAKIVARRERRILARLVDEIDVRGARVLDVPCGTGKLAPILGPRARSIVAADISEEMMAFAKEDYGKHTSFEKAMQCDATAMPFANDEFDCCIMLRLLHRVPDDVKQQMLREVGRVARSHAVVSYSSAELHRFSKISRPRSARRVLYPTSKKDFARMCEKAGLQILREVPLFRFASSEVIVRLRPVAP